MSAGGVVPILLEIRRPGWDEGFTRLPRPLAEQTLEQPLGVARVRCVEASPVRDAEKDRTACCDGCESRSLCQLALTVTPTHPK